MVDSDNRLVSRSRGYVTPYYLVQSGTTILGLLTRNISTRKTGISLDFQDAGLSLVALRRSRGDMAARYSTAFWLKQEGETAMVFAVGEGDDLLIN